MRVALTPTGPRVPERRGTEVGRTAGRAVVERITGVQPSIQRQEVEFSRPRPGFRLKTAESEHEIDQQISRLLALVANDNIDPAAPPGSYLNMLV